MVGFVRHRGRFPRDKEGTCQNTGMDALENTLLGKAVGYGGGYDPGLLLPIPRSLKRAELGFGAEPPFVGVDVWNAYELGWLDARGKPRVAMAEFRVPADSPSLIESKSLKLYLNGYARTRIANADELRSRLASDLSAAAGAATTVTMLPLGSAVAAYGLEGEVIDDLPLDIEHYAPPLPDVLRADTGAAADEALVSHLFKSNCPVTGQPDWASVRIDYRGPRIGRQGLLRYLVSYREHSDFHEHCVERIFADLLARCAPVRLSVYARYTRRGGLDINPFRATPGMPMPGNSRTARQ